MERMPLGIRWLRERHWKVVLIEVPNGRAQTLQACIEQHILPGTHIISDGWPAYTPHKKESDPVLRVSIISFIFLSVYHE